MYYIYYMNATVSRKVILPRVSVDKPDRPRFVNASTT
jgi:hypothetical protein